MRVRARFPVVTVEPRRVRLDPASWPKFGLIKRVCRPSGCACVLARGDGRTKSWGAITYADHQCGDCPARPCRLSRRSTAGACRGGQSSLFGFRGHGRAQSQFDRAARSLAEERRPLAQARSSLCWPCAVGSSALLSGCAKQVRRPCALENTAARRRPCSETAPAAPLSAGSLRSPAMSGTDSRSVPLPPGRPIASSPARPPAAR